MADGRGILTVGITSDLDKQLVCFQRNDLLLIRSVGKELVFHFPHDSRDKGIAGGVIQRITQHALRQRHVKRKMKPIV